MLLRTSCERSLDSPTCSNVSRFVDSLFIFPPSLGYPTDNPLIHIRKALSMGYSYVMV